ncbi:MAG: septum formation initiator family protein [Oscillospiraceae bacterium]|nr:septum formation initiator family protein [Oscillospiraceae bacterium]
MYIALFVFAVYIIAQFVSVQIQISKNNTRLKLLRNQIEEQDLLNQELSHELETKDDAAYIWGVAREKYDFVYPGETMFYDMGE